MKNVGVRFHDGSEVVYLHSVRIQTGTDAFLRVLGPINEVFAEIPIVDIKELFEDQLEEVCV